MRTSRLASHCVILRLTESLSPSAAVLVSVVLEESSEGLLECTRVYGNLSRYPTVRRILAEKKGELEGLVYGSNARVCLEKELVFVLSRGCTAWPLGHISLIPRLSYTTCPRQKLKLQVAKPGWDLGARLISQGLGLSA